MTVTLALFSLCQLQTPNQASAFWIGFDPFAFFQGPFLHFHTHGSITDRAFNNQIFAPSCIPKVIEAVKQVDKEETKFFPHTPIPVHAPILGIIQEAYVPAHHFDRNNGMGGGDPYVGSKEAFKLGVLYLKDRRKEIVDQAKSGNTDAAIAALGQALHALQDFFAHSNFVNLNSNPTSNPLSPEQQKLIDYLLSESPPGDFSDLPNGLLITAFGHVDPEDIYPHNATEISPLGEAKDNPNHHDHDLAATFAASASVTFLNQHVSLFHDMDDKCAAAWKDSSEIGSVGGLDPNDKAGLQGSGQALYLSGAGTLRYAIFFENLPTATAAAQEVVITDQLDPTKVDASTFNLGLITFGERSVNPPPGLNRYTADVDLRPANNLIVRINAGLDPTTGIAIWRFISLDATTGLPTDDPLAGFLPPDKNPPEGQGSVLFSVRPKQGLATGTEMRNKARIVFDVNEPIDTPAWLNTFDNTAPTSHVVPLATTQTAPIFTINWAGTDVGSGVDTYTIFVSRNDRPFEPFLSDVSATSAAFTGERGATYSFFSLARDRVGNIENKLAAAETTTLVVPLDTTPPMTTATLLPAANSDGWNNTDVVVALSATDNVGGSGVKEIRFSLSGAQAGEGPVGGSSTSMTIAAEGITTLTYFAVDNAGNQEAPKTLIVKIDRTAPTVAFDRPTPIANAAGWNKTDVSISFTANDDLSGIDASRSKASPLVLTTEGIAVSGTVTVTDKAGNTATYTSPVVMIDKTPPTVACVRVPRRKHEDDERAVFKVTASDTTSGVSTIALGSFQLSQGELIQIQPSRRSGVRLVGKTDDDDGDDPTIRRFRVGPGEGLIKATDESGNVGTAVCPLPSRRADHDDGRGDDSEKGRASTGSNRRVEGDR